MDHAGTKSMMINAKDPIAIIIREALLIFFITSSFKKHPGLVMSRTHAQSECFYK
jgi:hypothetical protein